MLSTPIAITIGAQAYSLQRKNQDNFGSTWMDNTTVPGTEVKLVIRNSYESGPKSTLTSDGYKSQQMERHVVDLTVTKFDANGFATVLQSYTHIRGLRGSAVSAVGDVAKGLAAFVTSKANDLVAWEN